MKLLGATLLSLSGIACSLADAQSIAFSPTTTVVTMIGPENIERGLQLNQAAALAALPAEATVVSECSRAADSRMRDKSFALSALASLTRAGARLVLDRAERKIQAELEKYSAVYRGETEGLFYRYSDASGRPVLRFNCIRIVRLAGTNPDGPALMDLVLRIRLSAQGDAIEVQPMRLFLSRSAAESTDGSIGMTVSLMADAVWRDGTVGRREAIFEELVFEDSVVPGDGAAGAKYYPVDSGKPTRLPIIPVSTGVQVDAPYGYARMVATVAEVGVAPEGLEAAVDLLARRRDAIAQVLMRACERRLTGLALR